MVIATLVFKIERIDVTWLGKLATFLLMFAVPVSCWGSDFPGAAGFEVAAWLLGIPASRSATGPDSRTSHRFGRELPCIGPNGARCCTVDLLNRDTVAP